MTVYQIVVTGFVAESGAKKTMRSGKIYSSIELVQKDTEEFIKRCTTKICEADNMYLSNPVYARVIELELVTG